jgi:hypothetical protein
MVFHDIFPLGQSHVNLVHAIALLCLRSKPPATILANNNVCPLQDLVRNVETDGFGCC